MLWTAKTMPPTPSFGRPIVKYPFLLSALLLSLSLSACSKRLTVQTAPLPASLRQPCPKLPDVPQPLIDPARAVWEAEIIRLYGVCGSRMLAAIKATSG